MASNVRKTLIILLAIICLVCISVICCKLIEYNSAQDIYDEAVALAELPEVAVPDESFEDIAEQYQNSDEQQEPQTAETTKEAVTYVDPYADAFANMDFETLKQVNPDVIGWIVIPDTNISYPLLQGEDNQYYLNHTWKKSKNASGAIFMEHRSSPNLGDFNTIIYGHRMGNSTMFGTLKQYRNYSYFEAHPMVYIINETGTHPYLIFSVYEAEITWDTYRLVFEDKEKQQNLIDLAVSNSIIDTGIVPTADDKILTLSTCIRGTGNQDKRLVVQAVAYQ